MSRHGSPLDERVLGIRVTAKSPDEHTVPLTVAQNRFLFNSLGGGFINMRLTAEEASEIVALGESGPVSCIGKFGCTMRPGPNGRFVCDRHRAVFKPSVDKLSYLWPRILDGLRFFGVGVADVVGINSFTLGMQQMSKFTAQLAPDTFGFLLGDAANSLHFWPGRGLSTGLKSALSLAVNLQKRWRGKSFRAADFAQREGIMQQLQYREKSRAWTTVLMPDSEGTPRGIEDRIREGLQGPYDRAALVKTLFERVLDIKKRMGDRMGPGHRRVVLRLRQRPRHPHPEGDGGVGRLDHPRDRRRGGRDPLGRGQGDRTRPATVPGQLDPWGRGSEHMSQVFKLWV